jgi:hypothetical protein
VHAHVDIQEIACLLMDQAQKESEDSLKDLAELLPFVVFEADRSGRLTYTNRYGVQLWDFGGKGAA